jgi:hypothetical protein
LFASVSMRRGMLWIVITLEYAVDSVGCFG